MAAKGLPLLSNHENADTLKSITSLVQVTLWVAGALAFMVNLWRPKKKADDPLQRAAISVNAQSGGINASVGDISTQNIAGRDIVIQYITNAPAAVINPLHQLPTPLADFTGRADELKELLAAVKTGGVTISGLQGLGGVGKTALALKLAEQRYGTSGARRFAPPEMVLSE